LRWLRIPILIKYFLGVSLVQGLSVLLVFAWLHTGSSTDAALTFAALGLISGLFAALWLSSMAHGDSKEALLRAEATLAKEREKHRRVTERERHKATETARKTLQREFNRGKTRTNLKMGGAVAGMAGLGTLLLLTQFMSLGILLMSSSGGALAGYLLRMRHEARRKQALPTDVDTQNLLGNNQAGIVPRLIAGTRILPSSPTSTRNSGPEPQAEHQAGRAKDKQA